MKMTGDIPHTATPHRTGVTRSARAMAPAALRCDASDWRTQHSMLLRRLIDP